MAIEINDTFDPVVYSLEECQFLMDHLGEPPMVAMRARPATVVAAAVQPVLDRVFQLQEAEKRMGEQWCGLPAVKAAIQTYLTQAAKWAADRKRGAPRFPSMHSFDTRNRPHLGGPGSDSGRVRTYINSQGERVPFEIQLTGTKQGEWVPDWADQKPSGTENPPSPDIFVDEKNHRIECKVCGHTEHFKVESRGSLLAANGRMAKHLLRAPDEKERHREAHTNAYGN